MWPTGLSRHTARTNGNCRWRSLTLTWYIMWKLFSENARVCAKWQWNALDWCYWIALPAKPVHIVYKRNWDDPCLINLAQKSYSLLHIFKIRNLFHCVAESWWNMTLKGTRHGNGVADGVVAKLLRLWQRASALWRHAVGIRIVTSHNAWMGYGYSLLNLNRPRDFHKHNPHPSKQWSECNNIQKQLGIENCILYIYVYIYWIIYSLCCLIISVP